ncbi:HAMP domain-containing protein [Priestia filamentosa]|uniref:HAMP domain-containing protein n=1 Tax=Priestia filamentosa TaxID=1402861 RepID=UPI0012FECF94|nr:HAMP domain-containing protein [Priestia filamentosa]
MKQAAEGNLSDEVNLKLSNDEIYDIGQAFNRMLQNMRDIIMTIEENTNKANECVLQISNLADNAFRHSSHIPKQLMKYQRALKTLQLLLKTQQNLLSMCLF